MRYGHKCIIWQLGQQSDCTIIIITRSKITLWQLWRGYPKHILALLCANTPIHRQKNKELPSGRKQRGMLSDKLGLQANTKALGTRQPDKDINQAGAPQSQADSIIPSQSLCSTLPGPGIAPNKEALPPWSLPPGLHLLLIPPTAHWAELNLSMSTPAGATP